MKVNQDLFDKLILYIGDVEEHRPYFTVEEVNLPGYSYQEIYDHISLLIEGEIIDGVFAWHENSDQYGYLIGGLTTESRYRYNQLKKAL
jgi:hypothetical protein